MQGRQSRLLPLNDNYLIVRNLFNLDLPGGDGVAAYLGIKEHQRAQAGHAKFTHTLMDFDWLLSIRKPFLVQRERCGISFPYAEGSS